MARFASGTTDQYIYFDAFDATDGVTRETGLSSFTVYRSRNGSAATAYTTPTILEMDATNMPGVYIMRLDEDMTIGAGNETEQVCLFITHAGMRSVSVMYELFDPVTPKLVVIDALIDFIYTFTDDLPTALPSIEGKINIVDSVLDGLVADIGVNGAGLTNIPLNASIPTVDQIADEVETRTIDANIVKVNSVDVNGVGTTNDPWGPA
jgi:hypothetical protein